MKVTHHQLLEGLKTAEGHAVIIDVYRAFTCAPILFAYGVKQTIMVRTPEEAFKLREQDKDLILVGEVGGVPVEGFDLGNSPSQILRKGREFFEGKTVVQRTSSGVQGVLTAIESVDAVLLSSYTLAKSTADYLLKKAPDRVSVCAMGWEAVESAPEDEGCAKYILHLLGAGDYDHHQAMNEIIFNHNTQKFLGEEMTHYPKEDPILCLQRDIYDFVLMAKKDGDRVIAEKIPSEDF